MSAMDGFAWGGAAVAAMMLVLWLASLKLRDASIVDIFWGPGFGLAAVVYAALGQGWAPRRLVVAALVLVWGLRLGVYLFRRNRGRGEDYRYQAWRRQHGPAFAWISLFQVFLLQGGLMWLISAPLALALTSPGPAAFSIWDGLGVGVWLLGFVFESVGDAQLARFKADPANRGQVMDRGLWRYTRHPNYFGDACVWWGFGLIALGVPWGWAGLTGPALMTFLLVRVSGAALLEKNLAQRPGYSDYIQRTSAFLPLPPRRPQPPAR